jgi:hypothetical protein
MGNPSGLLATAKPSGRNSMVSGRGNTFATFAAYIGMRLRFERKLTSKARIKDIKNRFLRPAVNLLETIKDQDFSKEFLVPWSGFEFESISDLKSRLEHSIANETNHIQTIQIRSSRGKQWDASLKRFHVYNNGRQPSGNSSWE